MNNVVFLGPRGEDAHPMFKKMVQRASLDSGKISYYPYDQYPQSNQVDKIVLLGDEALKYYVGEWDLFRWRGRLTKSARLPGVTILPTLQPSEMLPKKGDEEKKSPLKHKPSRFQGIWVWDVHKLINSQGVPDQRKVNYYIDPPLPVWNQLVKDFIESGKLLSFDIETHYKMKMEDEEDFENDTEPGTILRISFAHSEHCAVSVQWGWPYLDGIITLLNSSLDKLGWNLNAFDIPRLRQENINVAGEIYDGMDAWHMLRSEQPMGLEYVTSFYGDDILPWKHLNNSNPGLYSCKDADYALRNFIGIQQDLVQAGMWNLFLRHSVKLMPILTRAGQRGNLVDVQFSKDLESEMIIEKDRLETLAQPHIPAAIRPRKRFKTEQWSGEIVECDARVVRWEGREFHKILVEKEVNVCSHCNNVVSNKTEHFKGGKKNNPCKANNATLTSAIREVPEWDEILPFNLNSSDQVKDYIRYFNHKMGKNRKTDADSCNAKHLKKLFAAHPDHPFYEIKIEFAKVAKTISTYVYHRKMDENNVVHGWFNNSPTTWRLAQRASNFMNVGKRETNPWAVRARQQIVARPGHCFVDADSTSIEAVIIGMLIGDQNYIKMANKSIHAWLCCLDLGIEFTDANIELVKKKHKPLYDKFKVANYLLMYGGDPYLMWQEEPKTFPTLQSARDVKNRIFKLIPALEKWQDDTRKQAKKEGVLTTPWGYKHYFYDVYSFARDKEGNYQYKEDGEPKIRLGQDAKTCLAFKPQNIAGGFGRETCLIIGNSEWGQYMPANTFIHDGYLLEVPFERRFEAEQFLVTTLTRNVVELGNIRFGAETGMNIEGGNWGEWNETINPKGMKTYRKIEV